MSAYRSMFLLTCFIAILGALGENTDVTDHVTTDTRTVLLAVSHLTQQIEELKKDRLNDHEKILTLESRCEKLANENVKLSKRVEILESRPRYDDQQASTKPVHIRPVDDARVEVEKLDRQVIRDTTGDNFTDTKSVHKQTNGSTTDDRTEDQTGDNGPTRRIVQLTRGDIRSSEQDVSLRVAASIDVAFSAYLTYGILEPGDDYSIKFDNVVTNTGNGYNPTTGVFTCPKSGTYVFMWSVAMANVGNVYSSLMKNGLSVAWSVTGDDHYYSMATQASVLVLSEGDVITVKLGTHTPTAGLWNQKTSFNGFIIH